MEREKRLELFENLDEDNKKVVQIYAEVLNIPEAIAKEILITNTTALSFLSLPSTAALFGYTKTVELLIKTTLFRADGGMYEITEKEKQIVKEYYNIIL